MVWEEGCLSVPDFWQEFNRPRSILLRYQTPQGEFRSSGRGLSSDHHSARDGPPRGVVLLDGSAASSADATREGQEVGATGSPGGLRRSAFEDLPDPLQEQSVLCLRTEGHPK